MSGLNPKNYIDVAKSHLDNGLVDDAMRALKDGLEVAFRKDRPGAIAQMSKIILDTATKIHEIETKAKVDQLDKTVNVNIGWAKPRREIE